MNESRAAATVEQNYLVVYKEQSLPPSAKADIQAAGGSLTGSHAALGVALARSGNANFVAALSRRPNVAAVSVSAPVKSGPANGARPTPPAPSAAGEIGSDPLSGLQWNMQQIHAPAAHGITAGNKSVVIGVLDSGIDDRVADLQGQVDHARSVTCIGGVANTAVAGWQNDYIGHGTHVAGSIAAKQNGVGIVGVAPGATLAAIKLTDDGFVYPEAFICGLTWAVARGIKLVNASLFIDPWYYNCRNDAAQRATWLAVKRAVQAAAAAGVTIVTAASNEQQDLAHPSFNPVTGAPVNNACELLPAELQNVITVSAVAGDRNLAYYSNHGLNVIDLAAPGGDLHVPVPGNASGQIPSTIPAYSYYYQVANGWNGRIGIGCSDGLDPNDPNADPSTCRETYALLQGTSAAAPHVTGVAALVLSRFGAMGPSALLAKLAATATPHVCPANPYQPYPADMPALVCEGSTANNGFYGRGEVDALAAVQ